MGASDLELRPYQPSDLDAMFRLDEVCFDERFRFSRSMVRRFAQAPNAYVVVGESGERLAGFCILHLTESDRGIHGYIVTLDVDPEFRRHGLASRMMRVVEETALAEGAGEMTLHVFTGNEGAIRFYERERYVLKGRARNFYGSGMDALMYGKALGWEK
ncbi:MAG TPA: N-acetyltransferase [Acidobacteriaceae bacterium]